MNPKAVHQFSIACHQGDGISNGMILTQQLLRAAGVQSEIYCVEIDPRLQDKVLAFADYKTHKDQVLLIHHGIGNAYEDKLRALADRCIMVFHNITPAEMFHSDDPIQPMLEHGWQQVDSWKEWLAGAIADSKQNLDILLQHGYDPAECEEIPLLVDFERFPTLKAEYGHRPASDPFRLLFVGRVMPHKNQLGLIEALYNARNMSQKDIRLCLVGNDKLASYSDAPIDRTYELGMENFVEFTGKVSDERLSQYFQQSDLYVSLSHHEGFGMPLIEAMAHQLPVLAYSSEGSNVANTIANAGLVLDDDDPEKCAAAIVELMESPRLRAQLNRRAQDHLNKFKPQALYDKLRHFMASLSIDLPQNKFEPKPSALVKYRIEGPYDSSYSLAMVNRYMAKALNRIYPGEVALYATEGMGDLVPTESFMEANPDCRAMQQLGELQSNAGCSLRLLYPPRASSMQGLDNAMNCYGWEESVLPWEYVLGFNHHLQFITTMSAYVSKALVDSGVNIPIYTTGIGVDHILAEPVVSPELPELKLEARFKLLHVSSCFPRKGVDCLLAAFGQQFCGDDNVVLIIKTFPNPHHDIVQQLQAWRNEHSNPPLVQVINRDLDCGTVRALYQLADVLVAPSRGEGFGLPMAEAMLHHLPVITTAYGGQLDFCTPNTSWLIDFNFSRANTHMNQFSSVWVEPKVDHLASILADFYHAFCEGKFQKFVSVKTEHAFELIENKFTWDTVANNTVQARQRQQLEPLLKPQPKFGTVTTWNTKCGIATYSELLLKPALPNTLVFANHSGAGAAKDGAHVTRCWHSGQDDPLTELENMILSEGIEQLLIQFNFSFFNINSLGRLVDSLHRAGVKILLTLHSSADVYWGEELKTLKDILPQLHKCSRILVHGCNDLNRLKSWGLIDNTLLIPHGVQRHDLTAITAPTNYEALAGKKIISSYGFILPHKGMRQLIEAFSIIHKQDENTHLLLVTAEYPADVSTDEAKVCRDLVDELQLQDHVTMITDFLEHQESLAWLSLADCIVFPYQDTQESSSAAVRWGLATEKTVLCTPLDIFEDVTGAVQFLPGISPADIAAGIKQVFNLNSFELEAQKIKQKKWLQQHDWDQVSLRFKNIISSLALNDNIH